MSDCRDCQYYMYLSYIKVEGVKVLTMTMILYVAFTLLLLRIFILMYMYLATYHWYYYLASSLVFTLDFHVVHIILCVRRTCA